MQKSNSGNVFEFILEHVNIVDLISNYIQVERAGKNYKALCPFHNEKTASFIVSEEKQLYHCFGCGAAGNAINFVMSYENLDYIDAVEFLADKYNLDISGFSGKNDRNNTGQLTKYYDILKDAAIYYYKNLRQNESALNYLNRRGISYETIKKFGLGFSNDAWRNLLDKLKNKYSISELEAVGLCLPNKDGTSHYDRFRNRIMFPIINPKGKIVGFGGRVMDDSLPKYLNSPETDVFNKSRTLYGLNLAKNVLNQKKQLIIAEGYMDVITLHTNGFENAVATLGTALTSDHARLMKRYADEVVLCYDSDFAGQKAALRSLDILHGIIEKVKVVVLGENLDPDDFLKKYGSEAFKEKVETALTGTEFKLNHLKQGYNLNDESSKIEFLSKAVSVISEIENNFEKNLHIERLGELLGVNTEMIAQEVFKGQYKKEIKYGFNDKNKSVQIPKVSHEKKKYLENQLIAYYIHNHQTVSDTQKKLIQSFHFSHEMQPVFDYIFDYFKTKETFSKQDIIENADLDISKMLIEVLDDYSGDTDEIDIELIMHNIIIISLDDEIETLKLKLKDASNAQELFKVIQDKMRLKQDLTMKMRHRKFKN
ncbi:DNA primase [Fusibacter tunisiensis]|uniref:DNA primase n=1 Tax=Fusibacter tunisiensis TaxID=1008308 RepID=A0ABS2MMR8_9FIRM|nr:DNA primase [Fusibacter tunisiensis]MBM7560697.1 DNA primase [Fusibacter tunisiensis]